MSSVVESELLFPVLSWSLLSEESSWCSAAILLLVLAIPQGLGLFLSPPEQLVALQGQNEAAAAPAWLTGPLCSGSRQGRIPPRGHRRPLASEPTWEVREPSLLPWLCRATCRAGVGLLAHL